MSIETLIRDTSVDGVKSIEDSKFISNESEQLIHKVVPIIKCCYRNDKEVSNLSESLMNKSREIFLKYLT